MNLPDIKQPEGRAAWAFIALVGGCMVFTVFAAVGVWLVRTHATFAFWLALAAHAQVFVGMGAMGWILGRRVRAKFGRDGLETDDSGDPA